jgi:hypothetical protein
MTRLQKDSPSAEAPVVVDDLDALDLTEAGEDLGQLLGGDVVVQVANVQRLARRGGILVARPAGLPVLLLGSDGGLGESIRADSVLGIRGLCDDFLLRWGQAVLHGRLCSGLRKVLWDISGSGLGGLGRGSIVAGIPPLECC